MEVRHKRDNDIVILELDGRLDAYWADHLHDELDKCIRSGAYRIRIDMSCVDYISSAGIRILLRIYKQLKNINGEFRLINISDNVSSVLRLSGIDKLLKPDRVDLPGKIDEVPVNTENVGIGSRIFEVYSRDASKSLEYELHGSPDLLYGESLNDSLTFSVNIHPDTFCLGIGAFGNSYDECKGKYGEFIGMCGTAAYLPTDGRNTPDFQIASGSYMPKVNTLYAITCKGEFGYMCRFEPNGNQMNLTLHELVDACFELSGQDEIGIAVTAETAGVVGASLIKSPAALKSDDSIFSFPGIQECISFTSEKSYSGSLITLFGIASRNGHGELDKFLRPNGAGNESLGHFHASLFNYLPLIKGRLDLKETVYSLFNNQSLHTVIHLLSDDREIVGAGDTELIRGAIWISPLKSRSNI